MSATHFCQNSIKILKSSLVAYKWTRHLSSAHTHYRQYTRPFISRQVLSRWDDKYIIGTKLERAYSLTRVCVQPAQDENSKKPKPDDSKNKGLFARFKRMYKDYWYVLMPVHIITSAMWVGGFYYAVISGVDVVGLLETLGVGESILDRLRESNVGYYALTYALYKVFTPIRYAVTLGGTTVSINYLQKWGCIKPVPSRAELKIMYQARKEDLQEKYYEKKEDFYARKQITAKPKDSKPHKNTWNEIIRVKDGSGNPNKGPKN